MKPPEFTNLGGCLAVNFVNTLQNFRGKTVDLLESVDDLTTWIVFMEKVGWIVPQQRERLIDTPWNLKAVVEFRHYIREFFADPMTIVSVSSDLSLLTLQCPLTFSLLTQNPGQTFHLVAIPEHGGTFGLLSLLAYDLMDLMANGRLLRVKQCESPVCLAYFVNDSGKRKWCEMAGCGNRQKSLRHFRRRHHDTDLK